MKIMGNEEFRSLEATLNAIKNFETRKKPETSKKRRKELFEEAKARIENWGSADFEMRRAILYRDNYLTMLQKEYSEMEGYEEVVKYLKSIMNPIDVYKKLKSLESGEKLKDITFMYSTSQAQSIFNKLIEELGIDIETEDSELIEEGE